MSDETPTPEPASSEAADAPGEAAGPEASGAVATMEEPSPPVEVGNAGPPAERPTFKNKFLLPLIVPVGVAATIIFYVLNVSRIFLAGQDAIAVTWASLITIAILGGGTALAASPKLRSSSLTLILGFGFLVLLMGGLISIGAASPKTASGPVQCAPVKSKITIIAGANNALRYTFPNGNTVKAGCVDISVTFDGSHTLQFDTPPASNSFPLLTTNDKTWAGTLPPGDYKFHCTIPGHLAGGMLADLKVTA
jgi:hypothetical protein